MLNLKKGPKSMNTLFQRIKEICDKLGVVAVCVDEEELIHLALEALPQNMMYFVQQYVLGIMYSFLKS